MAATRPPMVPLFASYSLVRQSLTDFLTNAAVDELALNGWELAVWSDCLLRRSTVDAKEKQTCLHQLATTS